MFFVGNVCWVMIILEPQVFFGKLPLDITPVVVHDFVLKQVSFIGI